jgi:ribosomal protein L7/L12
VRTTESAKKIALAFLSEGPLAEARAVLLESRTQEFPEGWVYFYQSASFLETGSVGERLVGNAPLFAARNDAMPSFVSYHRPLVESMEAFRLSGNADAQPNSQVRLLGWKPGALAVSAIQAVRQHSSLGLVTAKEAIDNCLAGESVLIGTLSVMSARELVSALSKTNFVAEVTYDA